MMLRDVCVGCGSADGEEMVLYSVEDTLIVGVDGVMGCTGRERD